MGITFQHAYLIAREARRRPLPEIVHILGRQTVNLDADTFLRLLAHFGFSRPSTPIELDQRTRAARQDGRAYISDTNFFQALGAKQVSCVDISDYEGADILLDLNQSIPDAFEGQLDFLFGGSVCDNVFDPAMYLRNVARLLKPGGRYLSQEVASNTYHPYVVLPPIWYYDFFVINRFRGVQVLVFDIQDSWNVYALDPEPHCTFVPNFVPDPNHTLGVFLYVEKGDDSTWARSPVQDQYRSEAEWKEYRQSLERIRRERPYFPRLRFPCSEGDLAINPPRWLPSYPYLGRLDPDFSFHPQQPEHRERAEELVSAWRAEYPGRIAIWGAGALTGEILRETSLGSSPIALLVDSDPSLWGKSKWGHVVESPELLRIHKPGVILISSSRCQTDILLQIEAMGLTSVRVETLFRPG